MILRLGIVGLVALAGTSCIRLQTTPIVIHHEVTIGVDKALEDYFAYEEHNAASHPSTSTSAPTTSAIENPGATQPTTAATTQARRERFHERAPQLNQLKAAGIIGETNDGFVDFVNQPLAALQPLVDAENSDRREVYQYLAQQRSTTPQAIAAHNAQRLNDKAPAGTYFRAADGKWAKKS
jgi:uncharacterized protein